MASKFRLRRKRRKRGRFPLDVTPLRNVVVRLTTPLRNAARLVVFAAVTWLAKRRISRIWSKRRRRGGGRFRRFLRG